MGETPFLPRKFFVTSGSAVSEVSALNAFDAALEKAGISQCNLIPVSSIIPSDAVEVQPVKIPAGTITFTVMAKADGLRGEKISAGLIWGFGEKADGSKMGIVAEAYGNKSEREIRGELEEKIREMAKLRGLKLKNIKVKVESIRRVYGKFGCTVVALIYLFK